MSETDEMGFGIGRRLYGSEWGEGVGTDEVERRIIQTRCAGADNTPTAYTAIWAQPQDG